MKKYILGFVAGISFSSMLFYPLLKNQQEEKYKLGVNNGIVQGLVISVKALESEFGSTESKNATKRLYSVKTSDVVTIKENGVNTVRIVK